MRVQTAAQGLFTLLMDYHLGKAKHIFGNDSAVSDNYKRKHPKKDHSITHRVVWSGDGTMRLNRSGPRGKVAVKTARKLTHTRGYYGKLRRGEIML